MVAAINTSPVLHPTKASGCNCRYKRGHPPRSKRGQQVLSGKTGFPPNKADLRKRFGHGDFPAEDMISSHAIAIKLAMGMPEFAHAMIDVTGHPLMTFHS